MNGAPLRSDKIVLYTTLASTNSLKMFESSQNDKCILLSHTQ